MSEFIPCIEKSLPPESLFDAALRAIRINPVNRPPGAFEPQRIGVDTSKYWGAGGVNLTVGFLEQIEDSLANKILLHMNAWGKRANAKFVRSRQSPQVRISRGRGGYWSYLGTDILHITTGQTMNLEGFTANTPESEFFRVIRHETGHTLGAPHEHMRRALVDLLDPQRTIAYFGRTQGWSPQQVQAQVLTSIEETILLHPTAADQDSIMCYQIPGECTISGLPIHGGADINESDYAYMASIYPLAVQPPPPPPPPVSGGFRLTIDLAGSNVTLGNVSLKPI